jgi:hypothetical protein
MKCLAWVAAVLAFLPFAAASQDLGIDASRCDVQGFSADPDPNGTNVRDSPNAGAPIIGHLPARHTDPKTGITTRPEFHVIGSKDGWLWIENASGPEAGGAATVSFKGPGWISGKLVGFTLGDPRIRRTPSPDGPVAVTLGGKNFGPESYRVMTVYGCTGPFVEISVQPLRGARKNALIDGYASSVCASRLTCGSGNAH